MNAQGSDKDWYLTGWAKYTDTGTSSLIITKVGRDFKDVLHFNLVK